MIKENTELIACIIGILLGIGALILIAIWWDWRISLVIFMLKWADTIDLNMRDK